MGPSCCAAPLTCPLPRDRHVIVTMRWLIFLAAGVVSCSGGSGPVPERDAAPDGGRDAGPNGDGGVDAAPDAPPRDGAAPSCGTPRDETELTPPPTVARLPRLAAGPDGYALAWLSGEEPHDVVAVVLDEDERATVYAIQASRFPQCAEYQAGTDRPIPVVELV